MAITITYKSSVYSTSSATSYTAAPTYTPTANSLLVAFVIGCASSSPVDPNGATPFAGHGASWSKLTLTNKVLGTTHALSVWVAKAGASPTNAACVATWTSSRTGGAIIEFQVTGADVSGTALQAIVQNPTPTGSGTGTGNQSLSSPGNVLNRELACFLHLASEATTPRTNWTETSGADGNFINPSTGFEAEFRNDIFETTFSATWSTSSAWLACALEIKADPYVSGDMGCEGLATSSVEGGAIIPVAGSAAGSVIIPDVGYSYHLGDAFSTGTTQDLTSYNSNYTVAYQLSTDTIEVPEAVDRCELRNEDNNGVWYKYSGDANAPTGDQIIEFDAYVPSGNNWAIAVARASGSAGTFYSIECSVSGGVQLYRVVNGTYSSVLASGQTVPASTVFHLRVVVTGTNPVHILFQVDSQTPTTYDDSDAARLTSGYGGLGMNGATGTSMWVDNLYYGTDYDCKRQILINHLHVPSSQSNFPMLFAGTYDWLATVANGGHVTSDSGYDIIFTDPNGTKLNHEIESYDPTTGAVVFWVCIPTLSSTSDTEIYVKYGNSGVTASKENKAGTWDSNFKAVYHVGEAYSTAAGNYKDSSSVSPTLDMQLTDANASSSQADGKFGKAINLSGDADDLSVSDGGSSKWPGANAELTISAWVYRQSAATGGVVNYAGIWALWFASDGHLNYTSEGVADYNFTSVVGLTSWTLVHVTVTGGVTATPFINGSHGTEITWAQGNIGSAWHTYYVGTGNARGWPFAGRIQEVRVSNSVRSDDWITTEYNNMSDPAGFLSSIGSEEAQTVPGTQFESETIGAGTGSSTSVASVSGVGEDGNEGGTTPGVGASSGAASVSGTTVWTFAADGSSVGVAQPLAVGISFTLVTASTAGQGTVAGAGQGIFLSQAQSQGTATVAASGQGTFPSTAQASGIGAVTAAGQSITVVMAQSTGTSEVLGTSPQSVGQSTGAGVVTGAGATITPVVAEAIGTSTVSGTCDSGTVIAQAAGTSAVTGVGLTTALVTAQATGLSTAESAGQGVFPTAAQAVGTSAVSGDSKTLGAGQAQSAGISAAVGTGLGIGATQAQSSGIGEVTGVGLTLAVTTASAVGTATVQGSSSASTSGVGLSEGTSVVTGVSASRNLVVADAQGSAVVNGVGQSITLVTASSTGLAVVTGAGGKVIASAASSAGSATVTAQPGVVLQGAADAQGTGTVSGIARGVAAANGTVLGLSLALADSVLVLPMVASAYGFTVVYGIHTIPVTPPDRIVHIHNELRSTVELLASRTAIVPGESRLVR